MPPQFTDNSYSTGSFTTEWKTARFTITAIAGPYKNKPIKLGGVREMSGMGFTIEGVNILYGSDGTGLGVKITKGREKPNEISLKLDMLVFQNLIEPAVCPRGKAYEFTFVYQQVDESGAQTFSRTWTKCVRTGADTDSPADNEHVDTFKFQPTKRG
jgi:hypothetical protein